MPSTCHLCKPLFALATAVCSLATVAFGQSVLSALPTDCSSYASIPLPPESEKILVPEKFPACASFRSYRGIGRPVNYSEARACAWQERLAQKADLPQNQDEPLAWFVGGSLILGDIYFNGAGVKRDVSLAMRFACESDDGMAGLALPEIVKLNASGGARGPFEFCNYAASTPTMTACSRYASEIDDDRTTRYYKSLKSSMTPDQREAFEKLLTAQNAYIEEHALEVYQGGTIRGIRTIGSKNILKNLFHAELVHFERKRWPTLSENQIATADSLLVSEFNKKLQQLRGKSKDEIDEGGVTADHLFKVEESWKKYRDAWAAFASLRYPSEVAAIRAEITLDRYRLVKTIY